MRSESGTTSEQRWILPVLGVYAFLLLLGAVSELLGLGWFDWMVLSR
jgi:hypothetical protein